MAYALAAQGIIGYPTSNAVGCVLVVEMTVSFLKTHLGKTLGPSVDLHWQPSAEVRPIMTVRIRLGIDRGRIPDQDKTRCWGIFHLTERAHED
jgi:hypothetical protein